MSREFLLPDGKKVDVAQLGLPYHITYDDVNLLQQESDIISRSEVDISQQFGPYTLQIPIMSAPMDKFTGRRMVRKLAELGGIGVLPRKQTEREDLRLIRDLTDENVPFVGSVGLKNGYEDASRLQDSGAQVVLVDVANGGMRQVWELAGKIKRDLNMYVMAGNIVSAELANTYKDAGIDFARVGIGGGGLCTTREKTGVGMPQLSAIFETKKSGMYVVADGGIAKPASAAKALAAGAEMVMIGSMLGGTDETPGKVRNGMKIARGQASSTYMRDNGTEVGTHRTAEGITVEVPVKGPVANVIFDLTGGIKSSMSYAGARNLAEFSEKAVFLAVSPSSQHESRPHILSQTTARQV